MHLLSTIIYLAVINRVVAVCQPLIHLKEEEAEEIKPVAMAIYEGKMEPGLTATSTRARTC